jgi:hypothetical protein
VRLVEISLPFCALALALTMTREITFICHHHWGKKFCGPHQKQNISIWL